MVHRSYARQAPLSKIYTKFEAFELTESSSLGDHPPSVQGSGGAALLDYAGSDSQPTVAQPLDPRLSWIPPAGLTGQQC